MVEGTNPYWHGKTNRRGITKTSMEAMSKIEKYEPIVGSGIIEELHTIADRLKEQVIQNINSTAVGGGVAEILRRMMPLFSDMGVDVHWDVISGDSRFFEATKRFHNALHNKNVEPLQDDFAVFLKNTDNNLREMNLYGDIIFIHDPQPAALVKIRGEMKSKWIWRCHIDISSPNARVWNFIKGFVEHYDAAVFTSPAIAQDTSIPHSIIMPSIDPLSEKNKNLPPKFVDSFLEGHELSPEKPIITQISRFDYLKDPFGAIDVYRDVKKQVDCQLVLAGAGAADDPEGAKVLAEVSEEVIDDKDIHVFTNLSDIEINALQRTSSIILQMSLKEGFGLTVTEALWKGKPVLARPVGGIPLQIKDRYNGVLCHSTQEFSQWVRGLLHNKSHVDKMGANAREYVRSNFLITRHLRDHLLLFLSLLENDSPKKVA